MGSKSEKDKQKQIQDKCQALLNAMLRDEDNKYCVDCDSKGPRWASWNLGVFLCIRCAGLHRNLGVHISKVKSVNLDSWTPEQVVSLQQMGNSRARAVYEANLPDDFRRPQNDFSLESFIRAKYDHRKYIGREWVPPVMPKVDWEKEIDEEIERQKRKKKTAAAAAIAADKKAIKIAEVPQIPKPKTSASPKPARSIAPIEKNTQDLLGLQNGEEVFSGFLSAPSKEEPKKEVAKAVDAAKAEEESFFNQPAPTEKEKSKLTKDSILALYGSAPQQPVFNPAFQQTAQQVYPPHGYQFQGQAFPNQQFTQFPVQNGMAQLPQQAVHYQQYSTPVQQGQFPLMNAFPVGVQQPQQAPPAQFATQFSSQFQAAPAVPAAGMGQFAMQASAQFQPFQQQPNTAAPNPFCANPAPASLIQQQLANMSLSQLAPTKPVAQPPVATNLWQ